MKIYRRLVLSLEGEVLEEDSYEYSGPVAECKGGSSTTTTQPNEFQIPYLKDIYNISQGMSQYPVSYYPGTTTAGFAPAQQYAQQATANRAITGSPLLGTSQAETMKTMQGDYLNPASNPWLAKTYETAARNATQTFGESTMPEIRRMAMGAGAYGGSRQGVAEGVAMGRFGDTLGNIATGIYGPAYQQERGLQTQATQFAPQLAQQDYYDIGRLAAVGEEQQAMQQAQVDEAIKRWEFSQLEPWQRLGMYSNLITGDVGGTTSSMRSGK